MNKIKYLKDLVVLRDEKHPELIQLKIAGIATLKHLLSPIFASANKQEIYPDDGIFELDLILSDTDGEPLDVELEMTVIIPLKNLPHNVIAIRVNAEDNSEIEIINYPKI
jgi:hypothetical protein